MARNFLSRRQFLTQSALAASALYSQSLFAQQPSTSPIVQTRLGPIRGLRADGVRIFRGVPFAQPPIGDLRFRPSVKPQAWTSERDATHFPASPMQTGEPGVAHSEDCLYLNIWAPEGKGPFPVFVWIHGGGFTGGHAFEPIYDGAQFAHEGIVCITLAYRLGVFGFLDMEPILGPSYAGSANNALRDLIAALEWVRNHVSDFGGDPTRVTIGGESAGAKLTDILMGVPAAQPLFHQMISESGGAERVWSQPDSAAVTKGFAEAWQTATDLDPSSLRAAPAEKIIPIQRDFLETWPQHFPLRAEIDGRLIPRLPIDTIAAGSTRGKRLLLGTNRDESALFVGPHPLHDPTAKDIGNLTLPVFDTVYEHYKHIYPGMTDVERRIRALTAEEYWIPSLRVADAHLKAGGSAYIYRLDFAEASGHFSGYAYHSLDVGLVWDKPRASVTNASDEAALATQMHTAWSAFIRGEVPAAPGLPVWPAYTTTTRPTMILDHPSRIDQLPQNPELHLWDHKL
jgi:para-nitrobenzyl esterase